VNANDTVVGFVTKYSSSGTNLGHRAVRWDAGETAATELGNLGTDSNGITTGDAFAINASGIIVGHALANTGGGKRPHAVAWDADAVAINLNTLLSPTDAAMWTLTEAFAISDTGWITGMGIYDPDGSANPLRPYERAFLMQIPEPTAVALIGLAAAGLLRRRVAVRRS
jgi:hypothetical protein